MTKAQEVYVDTLNLFGTGFLDPDLQKIVDAEHAAADPAFELTLAERREVQAFVVT